MKKSKIAAALAVVSALVCPISLIACENGGHEHTFDTTKWEYVDGSGHYNPATCEHTDELGNFAPHVYDNAADTTCNVCDYVRTVTPEKQHGTLSGKVTAGGKALNGVTVAVGKITATTGADGTYSLGNIEIADSVTVTFTKAGYRTETKTVAKLAWTDKKSTLDAEMTLEVQKAKVKGKVKCGEKTIVGATVTFGELTPVKTGADGAFSFEVPSDVAATLTLTVSHNAYKTHTENIEIKVGDTQVSKDVSLEAKTVTELGGKPLPELNAMTAVPAADYSFKTQKQGEWQVSTTSYDMANEGILFHEAGQDIASGSKELKLFAYNRYTFDATEQIIIRARRFSDPSHNPDLQGHPEVYMLLVAEDGTVVTPTENPGEVTSTIDECNVLEFTLAAPITGKYVFAVGTTRGNRVAIESVAFRGVEVSGKVTGTIKQKGGEALEGATVAFGDGAPVTTAADGTFSIDVTVRKGGSDKITVTKDGVSIEIPFTSYYIYIMGVQNREMEYAAVMSWFLFAVTFIATFPIIRARNKASEG